VSNVPADRRFAAADWLGGAELASTVQGRALIGWVALSWRPLSNGEPPTLPADVGAPAVLP